MAETTFVKSSNGTSLAAHTVGSGPPLYVLHGGPENDHRTFGDYLNPVADYRTVHLLDQRGCGESEDAPPASYTLVRLAEDIEDTRVGAGKESIDLLGHSYGGLVALTYAVRHPEHVGTLIIVSSPARGWTGVVSSPSAWLEWGRLMLMNFKKDVDWTGFHLQREVANRSKANEVRAILEVPKRYDRSRSAPLMKVALRSIDVTGLARRMRAVAIFGRQDRRFVWDAPHFRSKGFRVHLIDNCGHFPYIEQTERFHSILKRTLEPEVPAHA